MDDIYSMATSVIAYIGEDFDGCDLVMETMTHVSLNRHQHFDCPEDERLKFRGVSVAHGGIDWKLIYEFLDTVWFVPFNVKSREGRLNVLGRRAYGQPKNTSWQNT